MNSKLLIDAIVRQTTVLLAQISTAAGIRSPLAHVADEVFVSLAREIEGQGVGRKVAADMFGLALRSYQKKVQRLTASATQQEETLWTAVLDFVTARQSATREHVLERFPHDGEREIVAVLTDLVGSGLLHAAGRGISAVYGPTSDAERRLLADVAERESLGTLAWATIRGSNAVTTRTLAEALRLELEPTRDLLRSLVAEGRIAVYPSCDDAVVVASPLVIPVGAEMGWEAAVFDHFRAVANAIAAKLRAGRMRSSGNDVVGGATLSFKLGKDHPHGDRVRGLLTRVRAEVNELWREVESYNVEHPVVEEGSALVWFYLGQYVETEQGRIES